MSHQGSFYYVLLSTEDDLGKTLVGLLHVALCAFATQRSRKNRESHACYGLGRGLQFAPHHCPFLTQEGHYADLRQPREVYASMDFKP